MEDRGTERQHSQIVADLFGHRANFVNIAFSYVHDRDVAEDIVNDVFVHLWERRNEVDWESNILGYVYLGVRTRCVSWLRKQQSASKAHDEIGKYHQWVFESSLNSLDHSGILSAEAIRIYRRQLSAMPQLTRDVFLSSRDEGLTYQEIARKLGISERRVTTEIQRALSLLRTALADWL